MIHPRHHRIAIVGAALALVLAACGSGDPASPGDSALPESPDQSAGEPEAGTDWPAEGETVTLIVPYSAGGGTDLAGRLLAADLEEELGVTIVVENRPAGSAQEGTTALANSEPDGYTWEFTPFPAINTIYLDPERGATFEAEDIQPVANHNTDPIAVTVSSDSPYETLDDLVAAAQAEPDEVLAGGSTFLGAAHLAFLVFSSTAEAPLTWQVFEEAGQLRAATLGGNVDSEWGTIAEFTEGAKAGDLRILAVFSEERSELAPDAPTAQESGYDVIFATNRAISVRGGTPRPIIEKLSAAIESVMQQEDHQREAAVLGLNLNYLDTDEISALRDELDASVGPLIEQFRNSEQ